MTWLFWRFVGLFIYKPATWGRCPWCGFEDFDMYEDGHFECTDGGSYAAPGESTTHWFRGNQTCPRCRYTWEVEDSD